MRYMIAKVQKDFDIGNLFGRSSSDLKFESKEYYNTPEAAEKAIHEKYQKEMDKKADETWNKASDAQQKDWGEQLKNKNIALHSDTYIVIPIQSIVEVNGLPEHLREVKQTKDTRD